MTLQWHITERCNLHCRHCYRDKDQPPDPSFENLMIVFNQFRQLLEKIQDTAKRSVRGHINIAGGEPLLHPDLFSLVNHIRANKREMTFALLSNGEAIDDRTARKLKSCHPQFVQVSMDGGPLIHDAVRGTGSHRKVVAAVERLMRRRIPVLISFTAFRDNYRDFTKVALIGKELNVKRIWADRLIPHGRGAELEYQVLNPDETFAFFRIIKKARHEMEKTWFNKTEIAMHRALQFLVGGGRPYHCTAGESLVTIMPNGDVLPCRRMPIAVGNIYQTPLTEIYFENDLFKKLRYPTAQDPACAGCAFKDGCRGGLKCLSFARTGHPFAADPGCWLKASSGHLTLQN